MKVNYCIVLCFFKFFIKRTSIIRMLPLRGYLLRKTPEKQRISLERANIMENTHFNIIGSYIHPYLCSFSQYKIRETNNQLYKLVLKSKKKSCNNITLDADSKN